METRIPGGMHDSPAAALEYCIALATARTEPVAVDSDEGRQLYRALAQQVWLEHQRPVSAADIRDLWQRIDTVKRGSPVEYGIVGVHFWAADFANTTLSETVFLDEKAQRKLQAWLDDWPNVCVLGQTGRGKSTTINRLFGAKMAEISHHRACTSSVSDYRLVTGTQMGRPTGIVLWDVPGYGDRRMSWDDYVKLYRRIAKKCDVVLFMLDHERTLPDDLSMFKKLRKRVDSANKIVVCINKADLFFPGDWDIERNVPSVDMAATIAERIERVAETLNLRNRTQIVPISALRGWNLFALLNALVNAAGESRAPNLLRALSKLQSDVPSHAVEERALGERFGIRTALLARFNRVIEKKQKKTQKRR